VNRGPTVLVMPYSSYDELGKEVTFYIQVNAVLFYINNFDLVFVNYLCSLYRTEKFSC
jgi:hypothetical protein